MTGNGEIGGEVEPGRSTGRLLLRPGSPRRARERFAIAVLMSASVGMLAVAVISGDDALAVGGTALCGTLALALAAIAVAETLPLRAVGIAVAISGIAFALSAVPAAPLGAPDMARLVAGIAMVLVSPVLILGREQKPF